MKKKKKEKKRKKKDHSVERCRQQEVSQPSPQVRIFLIKLRITGKVYLKVLVCKRE